MTASGSDSGSGAAPPTYRAGVSFGASDMVGLVIGGELTITRALAEGGMGAVFVALQRSTGKERALKLMHREIAADPEFKRRFEQEAQVGSRIRSEHVVEVLGAGVDAKLGLPYLVMELLEGEDLRHRLGRSGHLPAGEVRAILEQLCHAMTAAHAAGVIHRDLKPENVFLARSLRAGAGAFTVKVLDFGIAKLVLESNTRATRGAVGSPLWMAPEQTAPGPVTAAADTWSLGLLVYEMLVGKSYWRTANRDGGNTLQLLREIVLEPLSSASERAAEYGLADRLPPGFDAWFARCIVREPLHRFQDASALWAALPPALSSAPSSLAVTGIEVLGATYVASSNMPPSPRPVTPIAGSSGAPLMLASETGAATPFQAGDRTPIPPAAQQAVSAPPFEAAEPSFASAPPSPAVRSNVPPETPLATVHERIDERTKPPSLRRPPPASNRALVIAFGAIAIAALAIATWAVLREPKTIVTVAAPSAPAPSLTAPAPTTPLVVSATPSAPPAASSVAAAITATTKTTATASATATATATATASAAASARPKTIPGGFSDPTDRNGAVTWKVQDRHVRLFTRLVSNDSNVADAVVRKAVEWNSWEYLRCYERVFSGAKDLPEGTISVGFDILDQLPRHAKLVSSTFTSDSFNDCVVRTLVGQTINAAGPDGKGHAALALRFVPN